MAKAGLINYSKELSKEDSSQGVPVLSVSSGWIMTDSFSSMMERISESSNISAEEATQSVMEALGGIPVGGEDLHNLKKLLNWSAF
ncbi:hypothetical protein [Cesiribacter sp. SM1]|uniref:hypothetical protein n=1 Tax=Cesiribacter sp. SM1 TaxID=2861196 RepID=UPI00351CC653